MRGLFRRTAGLDEFVSTISPKRFRKAMTVRNRIHPPMDFEPTIATRTPPELGFEMAASQSLRDRSSPLQPRPKGLARFFVRSPKITGDR